LRIILCDRCGAKITREDPIGHITVYGESNGYAQGNNDFAGWDFYPDCMEEIYGFIKMPDALKRALKDDVRAEEERPEEKQEPEPEEEPKAESKEAAGAAKQTAEAAAKPAGSAKADAQTPHGDEKAREAEIMRQYDELERKAAAKGPCGTKSNGQIERNRIDWDKFRACVAAGKSIKWLTTEYGVSDSTIWSWKRKLKEMDAAEQTK
jgi:pyruvate/2-oxoglutarate dehydrogenase complex dihydrolipoamide acyltransferase (E2) component